MSSTSSAVWFITGTSTGFGRDLTVALLERGERVIATARNVEKIRDLEARGAAVLALDVTAAPDELVRIAETAIGIYGHIDHLINNTGYVFTGTVEESSAEETFAQFNTNIFGLLNTTRAFLPHLRQRRAGTIVLISSVAGFTVVPGASLYAASKFALEALGEGLAGELAPLGIRVLLVEPGYFHTDLLSATNQPRAKKVIPDYTPLNKALTEGLAQMNGRQQGDPKLGVKRIIELVTDTGPAEGREVPLRVALGMDSVEQIREKSEETLKSLEAWEAFSASTDFKE